MYFQADSLTTIFNILDELTGKDLSKKEEFFIITKTFLQQTKAQSQNKQILKDENSIYLENRNKLITLLKLNDGTKTEFIERYLPFDMTKAEKIDADAFSNMLHHQLSVLREMYKEPTPEYTHCVVESINLINTITLLLERNNKSIDKANQISKETNTLNNINRAFKSALGGDFKTENITKYKQEVELKFSSVYDDFTEEVFDILWLYVKDLYESITKFCLAYQQFDKAVSTSPCCIEEIRKEYSKRVQQAYDKTMEIQAGLMMYTNEQLAGWNREVLKRAEEAYNT